MSSAVLVGVAIVLLCVVLGPLARAQSTSPSAVSLSYAPPYTSSLRQTGTILLSSTCHALSGFVVPPAAHPATGRVAIELYDASKGCATTPTYAAAGGNMGFSGPDFTVPTNCTCNVSFEWQLTWKATLTATPSSNVNFSGVVSLGSFYLVDFVYDVTEATYVGFADDVYAWQGYCSNGTLGYSGHDQPFWTNTSVALNTSDQYELQSNLYVYFDTYTPPGTSASGTFDLATQGTGGQLTAMTVEG